jgi:hypothetical protein
VRRPYDLGDRIVLSSADGLVNPGVAKSWFVEGASNRRIAWMLFTRCTEQTKKAHVSHIFVFSTCFVDLNLYSTTLRYSQSNEVATVSNGTISGSRIVNCNRSPNAVVVFDLMLHICVIEDDKAQVYVSAIEQIIHDHPRIWECVVFFRYDKFDADNEQAFCRIAVRHRNSWQDACRILRDKGELQKCIYQLSKSMVVNFDSPPARRVIYTDGTLRNGQVEKYERGLLAPTSIPNTSTRDEPLESTGQTPIKQVMDGLFG